MDLSSREIAISARNLTKTYRLFGHPGDRIKQFVSLGLKRYHRDFTALNDVSFDIMKGETVGIIGRNGSGKSTLLQLICGILTPTSGTVQVNGRVSALLELGAGFNPDFTGRENVYFQGALMGITKAQMDERFDEIAAFADIGEFMHQPVRMYSSGLFVRLAFAVAVSADPDILIVDEALAVGDAGFRARCYRRIGELRDAKCTILFVSHAMDQVASLCSMVIVLDEGEYVLSGTAKWGTTQFLRLLNAAPGKRQVLRDQIRTRSHVTPDATCCAVFVHAAPGEPDSHIGVAYEPNGAVIEDVRLVDEDGRESVVLRSGQNYLCRFRTHFTQDAAGVRCAMVITTQDGIKLGGAITAPTSDDGIPAISAGANAVAEFEFRCLLNSGVYLISVAVFASTAGVEYALHGIQGGIGFRVENDKGSFGIESVDFGIRTSVNLTDPDVAR